MTVCTPYYSPDGTGLPPPPLVNGFHDGLRAVVLCGWQRIAQSSARQRLSRRFARRIAQQMVSDCPHLRSPTAFSTICVPYCTPDGAADRSFFLSSTAFTMVCVPYCSADGSGLLIPPLVNGFPNGLHAELRGGWQRIAPSSACQRLFRRFTRRNAQRMTADCSYFRSSKPFTTHCVPFCSVDGSALLILQFVKGFHDGLCAILLRGLQRIAHTSARQRLSQRFARHIAQWTAVHCSFFRSSMAFPMVRAPYGAVDGSGLLIPPLVNGFHHGLRAVLISGWQQIAHSSTRHRISRFACRFAPRMVADCSFFRSLTSIIPSRFGYCIPQRMAADCSFLHSSTAFTMVLAPYYSADS